MRRFDFNREIWEAQPTWAKIVQTLVLIPVLLVVIYTIFFDRNDPHGHIFACVVAIIPVGMLQAFYFIRSH